MPDSQSPDIDSTECGRVDSRKVALLNSAHGRAQWKDTITTPSRAHKDGTKGLSKGTSRTSRKQETWPKEDIKPKSSFSPERGRTERDGSLGRSSVFRSSASPSGILPVLSPEDKSHLTTAGTQECSHFFRAGLLCCHFLQNGENWSQLTQQSISSQ